MALLLLCSFVVLPFLVEIGRAKAEILCEGQDGQFLFKTKEDVASVDVKDSKNNKMLYWIDGQCHPYDTYTRKLKIENCNETDIEFKIPEMTHLDSGNITLLIASESTVLSAQTVTVAMTVFLNKSCGLYEERRLRCENLENLYNRRVQVKDAANNILLTTSGSYFEKTFPETAKGPFRVVLDANPICYVPFTFELKSATPGLVTPEDNGSSFPSATPGPVTPDNSGSSFPSATPGPVNPDDSGSSFSSDDRVPWWSIPVAVLLSVIVIYFVVDLYFFVKLKKNQHFKETWKNKTTLQKASCVIVLPCSTHLRLDFTKVVQEAVNLPESQTTGNPREVVQEAVNLPESQTTGNPREDVQEAVNLPESQTTGNPSEVIQEAVNLPESQTTGNPREDAAEETRESIHAADSGDRSDRGKSESSQQKKRTRKSKGSKPEQQPLLVHFQYCNFAGAPDISIQSQKHLIPPALRESAGKEETEPEPENEISSDES